MNNIGTSVTRHLHFLSVVAGALVASSVATAVEIEAQFNAGVGHSDNVARTSDSEIDETIGIAGMSLSLSQESRRVRADIRSQLDYLHYADDTFDDELVGGLSGDIDITLVDERIFWTIEDDFGQQTVNPLSPASPGNREDVNFFVTGPTINLFPASRNFARIDLRYSNVNYEEQDIDNDRTSAAISLGREIRRGASVSLNASTSRVEYDNDGLTPDFDRHEGFARYQLDSARNTFSLDIGVTEIDIEGEQRDGVLGRITWTREVSPGTTFELSGGSQYSDQGDIFRIGEGRGGDLRETSDIVSNAAPFTNNFASVAYRVARERTTVTVGLNWNQEDYEGGLPIDRDLTSVTFGLRRDLSPSTFASLRYQYRRRDFKYLDIVDDNSLASLEFGYEFSPAASLTLQYAYFDRSGDNAFSEATENRVFLRFFYTPRWGAPNRNGE